VISEAHELGVKAIDLAGGEPCLYPNLLDLIRFIEGKGLEAWLITNATFVPNNYITDTSLSFQITLDGADARTHGATRGSQNFYDVLRFLDRIKKENAGDRVNLRFNLHMKNINQIQQMIALACNYDIEKVAFSILHEIGRGVEIGNDINIHANRNLAKKLFQDLENIKKKYKNSIDISIPVPHLQYTCPLFSSNVRFNAKVDFKGNIFACSLFSDPVQSLGHISDTRLASSKISMKLSDLIQDITDAKKTSAKCTSCIMNSKCDGGCVAIYYEDIKEHEEICRHIKSGLKSAALSAIKNRV